MIMKLLSICSDKLQSCLFNRRHLGIELHGMLYIATPLNLSLSHLVHVNASHFNVQEAFGGELSADHLQLYFGPNDRKIGRQFANDPNVAEDTQTLAKFSVLPWLQRFPSWRLGVKLIPAAPPAPGVAIKKAAALAEGKDPDKAVQEARSKVIQSSYFCIFRCVTLPYDET